MKEFDTSAGAHAHWPDRFFSRVVNTHLARTRNTGAAVGDARCFLLDGGELLAFALLVMKAVAADPRAADDLLDAPLG
jgi:hypothetical protein